MIPKEDVVVLVTKDGYIKRTSYRSYTASNMDDLTLKENDYIIGLYDNGFRCAGKGSEGSRFL